VRFNFVPLNCFEPGS